MPDPQNLRNHTRLYPPFHLFVLPALLLNFGFSVYVTIHHWPQHRALFGWWIVMSIVLFVLAGLSRGFALQAQDRIIRLEERLRLAALLPPADLTRADSLTERQLIALRFASDGELPSLVSRTLNENLTSKQIKQAISTWRPDNFRV